MPVLALTSKGSLMVKGKCNYLHLWECHKTADPLEVRGTPALITFPSKQVKNHRILEVFSNLNGSVIPQVLFTTSMSFYWYKVGSRRYLITV